MAGRGAPPALLHDLRVAEENAVVQGVTDRLHPGALYDDDGVEVNWDRGQVLHQDALRLVQVDFSGRNIHLMIRYSNQSARISVCAL